MRKYLLLLPLLPSLIFGQINDEMKGGMSGGMLSTFGEDVVPGGYCDEYQAVYDAFATTPSSTIAGYQNTFVQTLVDSFATWDSLYFIHVYAAHLTDSATVLIDWINPGGTFEADTLGSPTFVAYQGATGGAGKAINTNFIPGTHLDNIDRFSFGCYVRTGTAAGNMVEMGVTSGSNRWAMMAARYTGDLAIVRVNTATAGSGSAANVDSRGMYIANRTAANVNDLYRNGTILVDDTDASDTKPTHALYTLCYNGTGTITAPSDRQIAMDFGGRGLSTDQIRVLTNAFEVLMDSYATGIIAMNTWYGFEFDETATSPLVTRVAGDMDAHSNLPIQSELRGCLLADDGTINYYLNASDWTKKIDGTTSDLTGTDGMVMIEVPEFYYDISYSSPDWTVKLSYYNQTGYTKVERFYISAFKATINRSTTELSSVMNYTATYRGGNNNASWDGTDSTLLGKPASVFSQANGRTYARNRGANWNIMTLEQRQWIYWLYVCEYATRETQATYDATLTAEGYRQGGLGPGLGYVIKADWNSFNSYYPLTPIGTTISYGNSTGQTTYSIPGFPGSSGDNVKIPRYRGIEEPFGDIWDVMDGINVYIESGAGNSIVYVCSDPANYASATSTNYDSLTVLPRTNGNIQTVRMIDGSIIPSAIGGSRSEYFTDYNFINIPAVGTWRTVLMGGYAHIGDNIGLLCINTVYDNPTLAQAGTRLIYLP